MAVSNLIYVVRNSGGKKWLHDPLEPNTIELKLLFLPGLIFVSKSTYMFFTFSCVFGIGRLQLALLLAGWLLQFQTYGGTKNWIQNS